MSQNGRPQYDTTEPADQIAGPEAESKSDLAKAKRRPRWPRALATLSAMVLVLVVALGAGAYWRLGKGPVSLPFLVDHALVAIARNMPPGYSVDLADVSLMRANGGLTLVLGDLALRDEAGTTLASAPRVDVSLDVLGLVTGRFEPRSITIEGAAAAATIDKNGRIGIRAGDESASVETPANLSVTAMMGALDALLASTGSLDKVELSGATLLVHDKAFGRDAAYRGIAMTVRRTAAEGGIAFSLAVGGGRVDATVEGRGNGARLVEVQARGISARYLAQNFAPGAKPPDLSADLDAIGRARIEQDGTVAQATLDVVSSSGSWTVEPDLPPFRFDRAGLTLRWDGAAETIFIDQAMLASGEGVGSFQGRMSAPEGTTGDWMIELDAPGLTLAGPQEGDLPLKLDVASVRGRYNPATRVLGIDKAQFTGPNAGLALAGSVSFGGDTPGIGLGIAADRMSVTAVKRLWPFFAVAPARKWFLEHAVGGILESATLSLAIAENALVAVDGEIPPLPDQAVRGEMRFSGSSMIVADTLPQVTDIDAHAVFSARRFALTAGGGKVDLGSSGVLQLSKGVYEIADLVPKPAMQHVAFDVTGPAKAVAALMTHEPLSKGANGVGLKPDAIDGQAEFQVSFDFPTLPKPTERDFVYALSGDLTDLSIREFEGQTLEKGALKIAVEPGVVLLTGKATVAGLPARIDYRKAAGSPPQVTMTATLDAAARKKRGLDFGEALNGPITAEVRVAQSAAGPRYGVDVDLAQAKLRDLLPGWQKAAGRPGKASFVWVPNGEGGSIEGFSLSSGPVALRGDMTIGPDGAFRKGSFDTIRFAAGDDANGTIESVGGSWKVALKGKSFDLRPILSMLQRNAAGSGKSDYSIRLDLDRALGFGDEVLSGFDFELDTKGQQIRRFLLKGSFGSRGIAGGTRNAGNGSSELYVETVDAGSLLRFLDYYTHVDDGILQAALTPRLDRIAGQIFIRDFEVSNETALGQYRTSLQQSGRNSASTRSVRDSRSAKFSKLRLTFERTVDRVDIAEAVVWGPEVGANLSGSIDYARDRVNLTGTFVPAYALNNLFSQIPVLGMILGGGQHEGLFAITFKVSGSASAPTLTVNPLSAIAPGFLRKLFDFQKQDDRPDQ